MDKNISVDKYISQFPEEIQQRLTEIRNALKTAAPKAEEVISYGMPTLKFNGNLVHYAGYKNHIGFYPTPSGISAFEKDIAKYKNSKGAVQFPHDKPLPVKLFVKITKYRLKENSTKIKKAKPKETFLDALSNPARNALLHEGINTIKKLSGYTEKEILKIHGVGPASLPVFKNYLKEAGLSFKK